MTKAELLEAIADAPDTAVVYIDSGDGIMRSQVSVSYTDEDEIILEWIELEETDDAVNPG